MPSSSELTLTRGPRRDGPAAGRAGPGAGSSFGFGFGSWPVRPRCLGGQHPQPITGLRRMAHPDEIGTAQLRLAMEGEEPADEELHVIAMGKSSP